MFDCREIAILDGMDQTVLEMLLDDILADLVQFAFDRGQLDQDIGTVVIVLDHCLDFAEMTDGAGQFVGDFFLSCPSFGGSWKTKKLCGYYRRR